MVGLLIIDDLERIWAEAVVACSRYYADIGLRTEENHEIISQDSRYPGRDSNRASPEYTFRMLPLQEVK
jgi:hypothetical protein